LKENIWIFNHYATRMYKNSGGRHYWFAENLIKKGYNPTVFCASTVHNSSVNIDTGNNKYASDAVNGIKFVFIKTSVYKGNGIQRIKNMIAFYRNLFPVAKEYAKLNSKPGIILASSVHPLTLVAGIKIAKKFGVRCICEVRDLWPESLVAYGILKRNSILAKILYRFEKWIYIKADAVIMTWEGAKNYIIDQGWDKIINLGKVIYISNGVQIDSFDENVSKNKITDEDLENKKFKNVIYCGSIRKVNNLSILIDVAKIIKEKGFDSIKFLIYGAGNEVEMLMQRCKNEDINNFVFKGYIEKRFIPYILKNAYITLLHYSSTSLDKYGQSQNKLFEYLAAGKCIVQTYSPKFSILEKYNCGITTSQNPEKIADVIIKACNDEELVAKMGKNAREAAYDYDFKELTNKLISVIESF
jgi:glycosyltransferase involved in cell wall biosynthesis